MQVFDKSKGELTREMGGERAKQKSGSINREKTPNNEKKRGGGGFQTRVGVEEGNHLIQQGKKKRELKSSGYTERVPYTRTTRKKKKKSRAAGIGDLRKKKGG